MCVPDLRGTQGTFSYYTTEQSESKSTVNTETESGEVYINGTNLGAVTVTASDNTGALVSAINTITSSTGLGFHLSSFIALLLS